jgi:nucleotide-binding universal stress UspA family protein
VKGDAGTWIVDEANRLGADVIVVGSKGSGVLKR